MESKLVNLNVRLSEEEKSNLLKNANENYMNMSDYIRHLVFNDKKEKSVFIIDETINQLNKAIKENIDIDKGTFIILLTAIKEIIK